MYTDARVVHPHKPNDTVTLYELNEELFRLHIPAIIVIICAIVVGSLGNLLVLLVYKKKFRRSNHRYFILTLAALDLLACTTGMPFLVASLRLPYLMYSSVLCKSMRYSHYLVNNSSGLLLLVISIERFRKICHPLKKQLSTKHILYLCYGTMLISAIIAIPAPIFYTASDIDTKIGNLTGKQCYVERTVKESTLFEIFQALLLMESIICIVVIIILYVLIARRLWTSDQFINAMRSANFKYSAKHDPSVSTDMRPYDEDTSDSSAHKTSRSQSKEAEVSLLRTVQCLRQSGQSENGLLTKSVSCHAVNNGFEKPVTSSAIDISQRRCSRDLPKKASTDDKPIVKRAVSEMALSKFKHATHFHSHKTLDKLTSKSSAGSSIGKPRNSRNTIRVTFMLFAVSIIFVLAFVPHLVLMIITVQFEGFLESLNETEVIFYQVFLRIFIINNIANPIIYFIFDAKFRHACKALIMCESCRSSKH